MPLNRPRRLFDYPGLLSQEPGVFVAEPKKNGYRFLYRDGVLWTRHRRPHQSQDFAGMFADLPQDTWIDGEVSRKPGHWLYCFDVLRLGGNDTTQETFGRRRMLLSTLGLPMVEQVMGDGIADAYERWLAAGDEGMVLKRINGRYYDQWLKVKP